MKRIVTILVFIFLAQLCMAATLSQGEATSLGTAFFSHLSASARLPESSEAYMGSYSQGDPDFYIVRFEPLGFVLVAAEEQSIPILGYSLQSAFPHGELPAHVRWYLDFYSRSMQEIRQNPAWSIDEGWTSLRAGDFSQYSVTRDVSPILTTTWDQNYPYNYLCPSDPAGPGGRVYAGCVATAMGQVMKRWNYPTTGNSSHSYYASGYGTQTANFGATTYNWASMPNSISSVNTNIATLLYHCGVSVDMQYGAASSGAYSSDVRTALVSYFRYNAAAQYLQASSYSSTNWANLIRSDLDLGRPVYYSGHGNDGGHAFVLDGYQGTTSFHFNWGWSGSYNGYFVLSNLNPGSYSFNQGQAAIMNVYPNSQSSLTGIVSSSGVGLAGATVSVAGTAFSTTTNASGLYSISGIAAGTYQVSASKTGYNSSTLSVTIVNGQTSTLNFSLTQNSPFPAPTNLSASVSGNNVNLSWQAPNSPSQGYNDGFETYPDFATSFSPWTLVDVDGSQTYGVTGYSFPNSGTAMSYIIFNQNSTVPPMTDVAAHSGNKQAACFASTYAGNDDWLISPQIQVQAGFSLSFWARSYTSSYGLERFKVGVSTTGTAPANFSIISGGSYIQAPVTWTQYSYNLSAYAGQNVYLAIQCVSNDAFIFLVDDFVVGSGMRIADTPFEPIPGTGLVTRYAGSPNPADPPIEAVSTLDRNLLGYKVFRNGNLIITQGTANLSFADSNLNPGTYGYTVTAYYNGGESDPAGPVTVNISNLSPPQNLSASVDMNDVTLQWTSPVPPDQGTWLSWSNNATIDNSIGTNAASVFDVAHMYDTTDLAAYQGAALTQVKFVPAYANCVYTVKVWTAGTATSPGSLVYSAVAQNITVGEWNLHVLNTPVPIPSTRLWIGYEVNTQGGYPAGCDNGPQVEGKGNLMNYGGWTTLTLIAPTLTYNWQIQGFVVSGGSYKAITHKAIPESPKSAPTGTLMANRYQPARNNRALLGYRVYRNGSMIGSIVDPGITTFSDMDLPNGTYVYGVTAHYSEGESTPATVNATVNMQLGPTIFADGFESYPDFALTMAPWTLIDQDLSATYGFSGESFPNNEAAMAYIVFNPGATTPPITDLNAYEGYKMAASFAAVNAPNSDWMVTPRLNLGTSSILKFYAKSHTAHYGLERFRVGVSTSATVIPQMFNYITGTSYVQVPTTWTEYVYDLSAYDNQQVYIAIRCVSDDAFVFYVDGFSVHSVGGGTTQLVSLSSGWNLASLNVSPTSHALPAVLGNIASSVVQIKGTDGVYIPNNPYSSLSSLTDGKAYNIQMNSAATWSIAGTQIPANTPIPLTSGWNMAAYLPQTAMSVSQAMISIYPWLQQVKGQDGVFIPDNPYSSLTIMQPGKGYWIQINGAHQLIYPASTRLAELSTGVRKKNIPELTVLPRSMTLLARCDWAEAGDILLAKVGDELRGAEELIAPEGFPAALLQIYCDIADEEISLWVLKADGSLIPVSNNIYSMPNASLGSYPELIALQSDADNGDLTSPVNSLLGTYPNPFNPSTTITFSIAGNDTPVSLNIYNVRGQLVSTIAEGKYPQGIHKVVWDGKDKRGNSQSSGLYIIELQAGSYRKTSKAVLSK